MSQTKLVLPAPLLQPPPCRTCGGPAMYELLAFTFNSVFARDVERGRPVQCGACWAAEQQRSFEALAASFDV